MNLLLPPPYAPSSDAASPERLGMAIAHEISQPLAAIALHAAAARKWLCRPEPDLARALESLAQIGAAGRNAGDIMRGMQRQAAGQRLETASVAVDAAVSAAIEALRWPLRKYGVTVETSLALGDDRIEANRVQLQQVVTNLLTNAIEALATCDHGRPRLVRIETRRRGDGGVEISVLDNGPGIAPARREWVLASLAGRADNEHGRGMGLAIGAAIAHAHGGQLGYAPRAPQGACFRLRLPMQPVPAMSVPIIDASTS